MSTEKTEVVEEPKDVTPQVAPPEAPEKTLVAFTPGELKGAQGQMEEWCTQKIAAIGVEMAELDENLTIAKKNKWRCSGLQNAISREKKRVVFYEKIKAAIQAGYLIVPTFPLDVFAIRTKAIAPKPGDTQWAGSSILTQNAQELPQGAGNYLSPNPTIGSFKETRNNKEITQYFAQEFKDVEFPVTIAKPSILNATAKAMSLKLFDEIGLCRPASRRGDPIVMGAIKLKQGYSEKRVNFFISWWMDFKDL